jgi:hypothetical protein
VFVSRRSELNDYIITGVILSFLVHAALVLALSASEKSYQRPPLVVNIIAPPEIQRKTRRTPLSKQIVSPTTTQETTQKEIDTSFESDKNRVVNKEVIKRGQGEDAGIPGAPNAHSAPPQVAPPVAPRPEQVQNTSSTKAATGLKAQTAPPITNDKAGTRKSSPLKHLKLDTDTLFKKFEQQGADRKVQPTEKRDLLNQNSQQSMAGYQAFNRPTGSGARFLGNQGTNDHLPQLPDGDITMLNTKANRFAVFVRRVATQVFSQLRSSGWESLQASDVRSIRDFSTVHAVLSLKGELLEVRLESSSGSQRFDQVLLSAVKAGALDPHPPEKAVASDGNIHFIFQAKSWSRFVPRSRDGGMSERRWLLLGTGLQ